MPSRAQGTGRIMAGRGWLGCLGCLLVLGNLYDRVSSSELPVMLCEKCYMSFSGERVYTSIRSSQGLLTQASEDPPLPRTF